VSSNLRDAFIARALNDADLVQLRRWLPDATSEQEMLSLLSQMCRTAEKGRGGIASIFYYFSTPGFRALCDLACDGVISPGQAISFLSRFEHNEEHLAILDERLPRHHPLFCRLLVRFADPLFPAAPTKRVFREMFAISDSGVRAYALSALTFPSWDGTPPNGMSERCQEFQDVASPKANEVAKTRVVAPSHGGLGNVVTAQSNAFPDPVDRLVGRGEPNENKLKTISESPFLTEPPGCQRWRRDQLSSGFREAGTWCTRRAARSAYPAPSQGR
jgi:hypothetical protein